jgi:hypothetical protein
MPLGYCCTLKPLHLALSRIGPRQLSRVDAKASGSSLITRREERSKSVHKATEIAVRWYASPVQIASGFRGNTVLQVLDSERVEIRS